MPCFILFCIEVNVEGGVGDAADATDIDDDYG